MLYTVLWEIEIEANSPLEAAQKANEMQLDSNSTATVFKVIDTSKGEESLRTIDLGKI